MSSELPTSAEIRQLPRWACVAFAARCARRAQPYFLKHWPDAPAKHVEAIDYAVQVAEQSAADTTTGTGNAAARAASAVKAAADAARADAADAARAARAASDAARAPRVWAPDATDAARAAAVCVDRILIRQDFDQLLTAARVNKWTDSTPVPVDFFGKIDENLSRPVPAEDVAAKGLIITQPMDHLVVVRGEVAPEVAAKGLIITLFARPETDPEIIEEGLVKIYEAANAYHMARGAGVLSVNKFRRWVSEAMVPVGGGY